MVTPTNALGIADRRSGLFRGAEMPTLQIIKGPNEGAVIPLDGDRFILGRNPDCGIVIPVTSVSREHAQILRVQGRFFIEDKQSRNGTYVNNQQISARTLLKNNDRIRICDFIAAFLDSAPAADLDDDDEGEGQSTVEAMLSHTSSLLLETAPVEKLRTLIDISSNLSKTLELNELLPKIADSLFQMFRQADRCFLIQQGEGTDRFMPRVVKTRRAQDESTARFSRSIVRRCLEAAQAFLSDDASRDDRIQLSQSVVDFRIRSVMCAPLCDAKGKAFGVIQLDTQDRSKKFTQDDLKLLCGVANQASIALENARLLEEAVKEERLRRDLKLAREVQLSFLPSSLPQAPGYEFGAHYEAAQQVGGDYYGFIPLPEGRLAVAVGDVAGKGVAASLMMAKLSSDTRFSLLTEPDPARAVAKLNDLIYEIASKADRFVTFALVLLDPLRHLVTLVSAGHPSPLLYRAGSPGLSDAMPKEVPGVPLGIMDGATFDSCMLTLQPGDSLILFTDGITESMDVKGREFRPQGIENALKGAGSVSARVLVDNLVRSVKQHAAGRDPHDDITVVALGRTV
jgi:serine phosphatase RsbU (regulator of sigma subunit)/pSer/pThr/pTyr-binding forkhead associated (FHA) protein